MAGGLFSLLHHWISHRMKQTPAQIDELYHQIVWKAAGK